MKSINVDGKDIFVDDEDYEFLTNCYDLKREGVYIKCTVKDKYKKMGLYSSLQLQKLLMNPERTGRSINVDHKDGNEDNYQKDNLRVCTHAENMRNRKKHKNGLTSIYKGVSRNVSRHGDADMWRVWINSKENKTETFGTFSSEVAAANCYNYHAKNLFGEFARLNDCPEMSFEEWNSYRLSKNKSSKYRGVSFLDGKWVAQIYHEGVNIRIGSFDKEEESAIAYNKKAIELKGNRAKINIIK